MVQLKQVSLRLKSIKNIQKITKTMKMVSSSKFLRAERELRTARPFGYASNKFYESSRLFKEKDPKAKEPPPPEEPKPSKTGAQRTNILYVAVTSDRGLCGGVHSGIARRIRKDFTDAKVAESPRHKIICIGDKSRSMLYRLYAKNMLLSVKDIGRTAPNFIDAATIAAAISDSGFQYDHGTFYYNKYFTPVKYELTLVPFFNRYRMEEAPNFLAFDDVDASQLQSYAEFTMAALLFFVLKQSATSEQSARMSAMENATNNANDMIRKLTLLFNRTRQAVITRELIEIISGAAALKT